MKTLQAILLVLCALCGVVAPASAVGAGASVEDEDMEVARQRWERLSDKDKARLRERYERLQSMSPAERKKLEQQARSLREVQRRLERSLSKEERGRLAQLDARERRAFLQDLVETEVQNRWDRVREKLPADLMQELEGKSQQERAKVLERFKNVQRERVSRHAIRELGGKLGYDEGEIQAMENLPDAQRMEKVMELRRESYAKRVEDHGLPEGMTPERWAALEALPPQEFLEEIVTLRADLMERGRRQQRGADRERAEVLRDLRELLRPRRSQMLRYSDLPRSERLRRLHEDMRTRALEILAEHPSVLGERDLGRLRRLTGTAFVESLRNFVEQEQDAAKRGRRGRRGGEPGEPDAGRGGRRSGQEAGRPGRHAPNGRPAPGERGAGRPGAERARTRSAAAERAGTPLGSAWNGSSARTPPGAERVDRAPVRSAAAAAGGQLRAGPATTAEGRDLYSRLAPLPARRAEP